MTSSAAADAAWDGASLSPRQREIFDGLEAIIIEEGFARLTIREIATRLKCSPATLYELAPSKLELVLRVMDRRLWRRRREAEEAIAQCSDPADQLEALLNLSGVRPTSIAFANDTRRSVAVRRLIHEHLRTGIELAIGVLDDGIASGRFRPVDTVLVGEIIDGAIERLMEPDAQRAYRGSPESGVTEFGRLLRLALVIDDEAAPKRTKTASGRKGGAV